MDLTHPIRALVPTLDGPVLEALARTTRPLSGLEVFRLAKAGSPSGVRRVLERLVEQGTVRAEVHPAAVLYTANREHLAWPAAMMLASMRRELLDRLTNEFTDWSPEPVHASVFGSMARGEGGASSDIDILLVRPDSVDEDDPVWAAQVSRLRERVEAWTGNRSQAFQIDLHRLGSHVSAGDRLVDEWIRHCITLTGPDITSVVQRIARKGPRR